MSVQLPPELIAALQDCDTEGLTVVDPNTNRQYRIIDEQAFQSAQQALAACGDRAALAAGWADLEAGRYEPLDVVFDNLRSHIEKSKP